MKIKNCYGNFNMTPYGRKKPTYIVIHYTAGVSSKKGTAKNIANYFNRPNTNASADYIVDDEEIVKYNPSVTKNYCWAVGGNKLATKGGSKHGIVTNKNSISIEICSNNKKNKVTQVNDENWFFTEKTMKNVIELVKYLCEKWDIPKTNIVRHYDVTGKFCPALIGWNKETNEKEWNNFLKQI